MDEEVRQEALKTIKFYNLVKKVVIRSSQEENEFSMINIRILKDLIKELRIRLDITKQGLCPDKVTRIINFGLDSKEFQGRDEEIQATKQQRIERIILKEFNYINIRHICSKLNFYHKGFTKAHCLDTIFGH